MPRESQRKGGCPYLLVDIPTEFALSASYAQPNHKSCHSQIRVVSLRIKSIETRGYSYPDSDYCTAITSALEMAIGTLSACLPTYRPILRHILKGRAVDSNTLVATSRGLHTSKFSRSRHTDTDASSVHPFNRLEESPHVGSDWTSSMPLADLTHTNITRDRGLRSNVDTEFGPHKIKIVTDFDQRSN